jgi:hypothetical protein
VRQQNTLLHWETLLIVTTGNLEDVSLELITQRVSSNFGGNSLIIEDTKLAFIIDFIRLLAASGWICDI